MFLSKKVFLAVLAVAVLTGCAVKVASDMKVPARSSLSALIKDVAVLSFDGEIGEKFTAEMNKMLNNAKEDGAKYFKVTDIEKVPESRDYTEKEAAELGKQLGVRGVYYGVSNIVAEEKKVMEKREKCEYMTPMDNMTKISDLREVFCKKVMVPVDCTIRDYSFYTLVNLVDVETGRLVYSRKFKDGGRYKSCQDDDNYMPAFETLQKRSVKKAIDEIRKDVAPYVVKMHVELKKSTKGIKDKADVSRFDSGLKNAELGNLEEGCRLWKILLAKYPEQESLLYNTAVCAEVKDQLDEAEKLYLKADDMSDKPDELVRKAIKRIKIRRAELKKLNVQNPE